MKDFYSLTNDEVTRFLTHDIDEDKLKTIDLFAGVGGIRLGMEQAGFTTVFSNDFDAKCQITFDLNFSDPSMTCESIDDLDFDSIPYFDVLTGGFPCQPFSVAGKRGGFKDERGNHFFTIARLIDLRRPTAFLLENVKGLLTHDGGDTFNTILETLYKLGYSLHWKVLNSKIHANIPQNRERLFIVGFKQEKHASKFHFPEPEELTTTYEEFLVAKEGDMDWLDTAEAETYFIKEGKVYDALQEFGVKEGYSYQWRYNYIREHKAKGCIPCLVTVGNSPIIKQDGLFRYLTPRECFNLQGFPWWWEEEYRLPNDIHDRHLYKQAGNSVTVPLIKRIADGIRISTA